MQSRFILCEGPDDVCFFSLLTKEWKTPRFSIDDTSPDGSSRGGNGNFGNKLRALRLDPVFRRDVKHIVLATDSDEDHDRSFTSVCRQVTQAGYVAPATPRAKSTGTPSISILMIPKEGKGNLECLCVDAARSEAKATGALVDNFCALVTKDGWPEPRAGKLWLRALLAARWDADSFIHLGQVFMGRKSQSLIPIKHQSFRWIADYLATI